MRSAPIQWRVVRALWCSEMRALFLSYTWPGNVRGLENVIERTVILFPLLQKGRTEKSPLYKGGRAQREGIFVRDCAALVWSDVGLFTLVTNRRARPNKL